MGDVLLQKRSITLDRHRTSLALEPEFWLVLEHIASARKKSLTALLAEIDRERGERPLASACRLFALKER
ncbi:MAG: ribbon-helix-helix domain-containing protein [Caulobacterales bacterium]